MCPQVALDQWKAVEREHQEAINEEAKHLEKLANKKSLLLKKVIAGVVSYMHGHVSSNMEIPIKLSALQQKKSLTDTPRAQSGRFKVGRVLV